MDLLKVGDRVENRQGWTGIVAELDGDQAVVEWDNGQPKARFGRDEPHYEGGALLTVI